MSIAIIIASVLLLVGFVGMYLAVVDGCDHKRAEQADMDAEREVDGR